MNMKQTPPGEMGWRLGMVLRGYQSELEDAVGQTPEGIRGFQILSTVVHRDPPSQAALGAHLNIDRTVLTYLLDTLVDADLVERVPAPSDRRARKIVVTDGGRELLGKCEKHVAALETELLEDLDAEDSEMFKEVLAHLAMKIHTSKPGTNPCEAMDHLP